MARLEEAHARRMAEWDKFQTKEFHDSIIQNIVDRTHSNIKPPWED